MSRQEQRHDVAPATEGQRHGLLRLVTDQEISEQIPGEIGMAENEEVLRGPAVQSVTDGDVPERVYTAWDAPKGHFED